MNKGTISTKLTDYNIYNEGEMLIGTNGEVTLPDLEAVTSEIGGAGIAGTMEDPTPGYFGSLEIELKFRTVSEESSRLMIPQAHTLTLRAAQTKHDPATGTNSQEGLKVVCRGVPKSYSVGTFKQGEPPKLQQSWSCLISRLPAAASLCWSWTSLITSLWWKASIT